MKLISVLLLSLFVSAGFAQKTWKKEKEELVFSGQDFSKCHASTIVEISGGKLLCAWFGGTAEGAKDVCIWISTKQKDAWQKPRKIADGIINDTLRYPCWNPVLFVNSEGLLYLYYKVGPSPQRWWGMFMTSKDEGRSWSNPSKLSAEILGPIKNKPIQLAGKTVLSGSSLETPLKWTAHMERSVDNGLSWRKIALDTAGFDVIQPTILNYGKGRLQILCRSKQKAVVQSWSLDNGQSWSKLSKTNLLNPNSGIDAITLKDGRQLLVYNPDIPGQNWVNGRAKLSVAVSGNGSDWSDIILLENGSREEYSYPAVIQTADGKVHITYTYDRNNIKHVVLVSN